MENLFIKAALQTWDLQVTRTEKIFNQLSDDDLLKQIAPGRNSARYLLGHLVAVNDAMSEILGTGKAAYPELQAIFIKSPDGSGLELPTVGELRLYWNLVHERLKKEFLSIPEAEWTTRHTAMTDEDFAKDPGRNKFAVFLNRTSHLAFHLGQLRLLV